MSAELLKDPPFPTGTLYGLDRCHQFWAVAVDSLVDNKTIKGSVLLHGDLKTRYPFKWAACIDRGRFVAAYTTPKSVGTFEFTITHTNPVRVKVEFYDGAATCYGGLDVSGRANFVKWAANPFANHCYLERLGEAIKRSINYIEEDLREQFALIRDNWKLMAGIFVVWAGLQLTPVGWLATIALTAWGLVGNVQIAIEAAGHLYDFLAGASNCQNQADMNAAAQAFSKFVALVGVQLMFTLLVKVGVKLTKKAAAAAARSTWKYLGKPLAHWQQLMHRYYVSKFGGKKPPRKPAKPESEVTAMSWLKKHLGKSIPDNEHGNHTICSMLDDMNLAGDVKVRKLPAGTDVDMYVGANGKLGIFCTKGGTNPTKLGVNLAGREKVTMRLTKDIEVLESTALDTIDTWTTSQGLYVKGGGLQVILPETGAQLLGNGTLTRITSVSPAVLAAGDTIAGSVVALLKTMRGVVGMCDPDITPDALGPEILDYADANPGDESHLCPQPIYHDDGNTVMRGGNRNF